MRRKAVDAPFLILVSALVVFGLLIFTSAALGLLARGGGASFTSVAVNQLLLGLLCGSVGLFLFARLDYRLLKPYTLHVFICALLLTMLTFVPHIGLTLKGASRWLALGPLTFQPVELLKLAAVLMLASLYASNLRQVRTMRGGLVPFIIVAGSSCAILLAQPDTHGTVMIALACAAMLFAAGGRAIHLLVLAALGMLVLGALVLERPYLAARFETFLNHSADPLGADYQSQQALIAVGSGGMLGRGFGQSIEKFSYLPEPIGDSIFAVAAEEFGFAGSVLLVALFALFAILGLRVAARAPDPFGGLIATGLVVIIAGQALINMASILSLLPLSGLPLIFVSHGGSALAIALCEVGIILSISRHMKEA